MVQRAKSGLQAMTYIIYIVPKHNINIAKAFEHIERGLQLTKLKSLIDKSSGSHRKKEDCIKDAPYCKQCKTRYITTMQNRKYSDTT